VRCNAQTQHTYLCFPLDRSFGAHNKNGNHKGILSYCSGGRDGRIDDHRTPAIISVGSYVARPACLPRRKKRKGGGGSGRPRRTMRFRSLARSVCVCVHGAAADPPTGQSSKLRPPRVLIKCARLCVPLCLHRADEQGLD
jgi:hypothetical protein